MDLSRAALVSLAFAATTAVAAPLAAQPLVPLTDEVRLTPEETCEHLEPDVAWTSDGGLVTVWLTSDGVVGRLAPPPGREHGPRVTLVPDALGGPYSPAMAPAPGGGFWLVWKRFVPAGDEVVLQRFAADGALLGGEITVALRDSGFAPAIAALADGGVAVAYEDLTADRARLALRLFDADGVALGDEIVVHSEPRAETPAEEVSYFDVEVANGPAGILVVWSRDCCSRGRVQQTMARAFGPSGETLGETVEMTPPVPRMGQSGAYVTRYGYLVAWAAPEGSGAAAFVGRLDLSGQPAGEAVRVSEVEPDEIFLGPRLAGDGARVVAAWGRLTPYVGLHVALRPLHVTGRPAGPTTPLHRPFDEVEEAGHGVYHFALAADAGRLAAAWQVYSGMALLPTACQIGDAVLVRSFEIVGADERPRPGPGWRPRSPSWPAGRGGS